MPTTNQNNNQNNNFNRTIKVPGYAKRKFFIDNIEYRNFADDLVGNQIVNDGGTPLFTLGNFKVTTNLSPKLNKTYNQGSYSDFFSLDDLDDGQSDSLLIQKNQKAGLNLDDSNPLTYVLYGSVEEKIRVSLEHIKEYFPAAIYVEDVIGSVSGNNITEYVYDSLADESTFTVNTNYFNNPFGLVYTSDSKRVSDDDTSNPLRNITINYKDYVIEHNGISKNIINFTPATTVTNSLVKFVVEGNPFPEITGLNFSQFSFLNSIGEGSIPFFIKPNEIKSENFFTQLNDLEKNLLNRNVYPIYTATFKTPKETEQGVIVFSEEKVTFPVLNDGYNLNLFDGLYITYLNTIIDIGENLDKFKTDIIKRKYTAEVITGFDTLPSGDGSEDLELDGAKANKLLRIYGVEFDEVKKYIDGIKFSHVITYNKNNNTPDSLVKDLANMLGFGDFNFLTDVNILKNILPSNGKGLMSGTSTNMSLEEIDIELYRRLILNVAWLWKSKGARKAIEFLFRFIGAPESLVNFNEYIVVADKPVNIPQLQSMLYIYTGSSDIKDLPFDSDGYPLPIPNGEDVIIGFDSENNPIFDTTWFQKAGGWYRETGGLNPPIDIREGNNPHQGKYDGGSFYMNQFITSIYPNQIKSDFITLTGNTIYQNQFLNYNDGFINGTSDGDILYITPINPLNNQIITEGLNIEFSVVTSPPVSGGTTLFQDLCNNAKLEYDKWVEDIKEKCELIYSPEWFRVQQNYIIAKNNLNREINSRNGNNNEALEICINTDCDGIKVIENPCDLYTMVEDNGIIYFTDEKGTQVNFDEFPQCCVAAGGQYFTYTNQQNEESFFCATEPPCPGIPIENTGEAILWQLEGLNVVPDNIIRIKPDNTSLPQYEEKCLNEAKNKTFRSEEERIKFLTDCTTKVRKEILTQISTNTGCNEFEISGCFQLTEEGEKFFGFIEDESELDGFSTKIGDKIAEFVIYDKDTNPVGYISNVAGITLSFKGLSAINYIKKLNGTVFPNYEKLYSSEVVNNPQLSLEKYVEAVRNAQPVTNFEKYFTPVDCDGTNTTYDSTVECCAYYGFDHYYVNKRNEDGTITTVVYCRDKNGDFIDQDDYDMPDPQPTEPIYDTDGRRPNTSPTITKPSKGGKSELNNPQKSIEKEIKKVEKQQREVTKKIDNSRTITGKEKSKLRLERINLEQRKIELNTQKQKNELKNTRTIKPATSKGYTKYEEGTNLNAVKSKGDTITVMSNTKGVYSKGNIGGKDGEVNTDFGSPFGNPDFQDITKWKLDNIDQYGRVTFVSVENSKTTLDWNATKDSGADLYKECCLGKGYGFGQFQINPETNQLVPYNGEPNNFTNGSIIDSCVDKSHISCEDTQDVKLILGSNGSDGFFLPTNNESNEVTIKFDYMIKYNAESLIACAGIDSCPIPLDLYTNSIYNLDCKNFIVFTEGEQIKNTLKDNILHIDTDIVPLEGETLDLTKPDKDGIPNLIPYWDSNNIQVWQTPGLQKTVTESDECCSAYGGTLVPISNWDEVNKVNVARIKEEFASNVNAINVNGNVSSWVDDDFKNIIKNLLDDNQLVSNIMDESCVNYVTFRGENYCDDFEQIITTPNVCALLTPQLIGSYSEVLKQYWKLINQLKLMEAELTICNDANLRMSNLIVEIDKEQISEEVEKNKKEKEFKKSIVDLETKHSLKKREVRDLDKQINDIVEVTTAIDSVKEENLPKIDCNLYQDQIKIIENFNIEEFCRNQTNNVSDNPDVVFTAYNTCLSNKKMELGKELKKYQELFQNCVKSNVISDELSKAEANNDIVTKNRLNSEYDITLDKLNELQSTIFCEDINEENDILRSTKEQENDIKKNVDIVSKILNVDSTTIRKGNTTDLTAPQKVEVNRVLSTQKAVSNKLKIKKQELEEELGTIQKNRLKINEEYKKEQKEKEEIIKDIKTVKNNLENQLRNTTQNKCCKETLEEVQELLRSLTKTRNDIYYDTEVLYQDWYTTRYNQYLEFVKDKMATSFEYMDELTLSFNLEVDNNTIGSIPENEVVSNLTTLPIMSNTNPIWRFNPQNYSGVVIGGSDYNSNLLEDSITVALSEQGYSGLNAIFEPKWQNFELKIPQDVLNNLNGAYPDKQFFLSLMLENYECDVCLLIDNIQINYKTYDIFPFYNTQGDGLPKLNCTIDNRKSWVYVGDSIKPVKNLPDGKCVENEVTCATPLEITTQNRLWQNLEYRYTEYDFNHSDLIINSKSAAFQIDPSKSIECDVYNFWKNINCDECPSSCSSGESVTYEGVFTYTGESTQNYELTLSATSVGSMLSDCEIYNGLLENIVEDIKENYYILTADYPSSLSAGYWDLIEKGGSIEELYIVDNDCNTQTLVIGDRKTLNSDQRLIVEEGDGTISLFGLYVYSGTTPYSGGEITEIINGVSAQTFNQTSGMTSECCTNLNTILTSSGKNGLNLDKNYIWNNSISGCTWIDLNDEGDCTHCGNTTHSSFSANSSGVTCEVVDKTICVNPLDFLEQPPSKIKVKEVFDEMVQSNLINAQNRQTISGYPTLKLFYELYLRANGCGEQHSGKLTYNNLFQFMDLIGDYWLELIEQVIPSTTIMEGCDNSGKVYRNTIFDNNKFVYKKYVLNYMDVNDNCKVSGVTQDSIGQQSVEISVEDICLGGGCLPESSKLCEEEKILIQNQITNLEEQLNILKQQKNSTELAISTVKNDLNNQKAKNIPTKQKKEQKENKRKEEQINKKEKQTESIKNKLNQEQKQKATQARQKRNKQSSNKKNSRSSRS